MIDILSPRGLAGMLDAKLGNVEVVCVASGWNNGKSQRMLFCSNCL